MVVSARLCRKQVLIDKYSKDVCRPLHKMTSSSYVVPLLAVRKPRKRTERQVHSSYLPSGDIVCSLAVPVALAQRNRKRVMSAFNFLTHFKVATAANDCQCQAVFRVSIT